MNLIKITPLLRKATTRVSIPVGIRQLSNVPSVNKVILLGTASNPRFRDLPSGSRMVDFIISTSHPSNKEEKITLRYHKVKSFNSAVADLVGEHLGEDKRVEAYVEGSLATSRYVDKNGENRYDTFVYGDKIVFLPPRVSESHESIPQREEDPTPEGW